MVVNADHPAPRPLERFAEIEEPFLAGVEIGFAAQFAARRRGQTKQAEQAAIVERLARQANVRTDVEIDLRRPNS